MTKSNFDSKIDQKRQNSALIPGKTNPLGMLKPCLKLMIVLNLVHETVRHLHVVAEEFKYSHMKQNFYSSFSILRHLNSLFHLLKGILAKL